MTQAVIFIRSERLERLKGDKSAKTDGNLSDMTFSRKKYFVCETSRLFNGRLKAESRLEDDTSFVTWKLTFYSLFIRWKKINFLRRCGKAKPLYIYLIHSNTFYARIPNHATPKKRKVGLKT